MKTALYQYPHKTSVRKSSLQSGQTNKKGFIPLSFAFTLNRTLEYPAFCYSFLVRIIMLTICISIGNRQFKNPVLTAPLFTILHPLFLE